MPVVLVGTKVEGRDNFMAVGWCARANGNPPMILCAMGSQHYTTKGITETKTFSMNIPSTDCWRKRTTVVSCPERKPTSPTYLTSSAVPDNSADDQRVPGYP